MRTGGYTLAAVGLACAGVTADAAIIFNKFAETGPTYTSIGVPTLNDLGVAAFQAVDPAGGGRGVYYGAPGGVQRLATPNLTVTRSPYPADVVGINNAGQIAFTALPPSNPNGLSGIDGVYRYNPGGAITTIVDPWTRLGMISGGPVVNDSGRTAFTVWNTGNKQLVAGDGTAAATNTNLNGSGLNPDVHVSNDGHTLTTVIGAVLDTHTVILDGAVIISDTSPKFQDPALPPVSTTFRVSRADLGDGGRVAFAADWGAGFSNGIYLWENGALSKVAGTSGIGTNVVPAINDLGAVAALIRGTQDRLSVFKDGVEGRILSVGDAFDGSTVTGLTFVPEGFNDLEQLAFTAALADGRSVNVLANTPEPGSVGALVAVGAGALLRRQRRGR